MGKILLTSWWSSGHACRAYLTNYADWLDKTWLESPGSYYHLYWSTEEDEVVFFGAGRNNEVPQGRNGVEGSYDNT
jgi:hypothetical protein